MSAPKILKVFSLSVWNPRCNIGGCLQKKFMGLYLAQQPAEQTAGRAGEKRVNKKFNQYAKTHPYHH